MELTVLLPCLNEEITLEETITEIKTELKRLSLFAKTEILVVDNGSTDSSAKIAKKMGAKVVKEKEQGYGNALRKGFLEAKGKYIIFGDCDRSYHFSNLDLFLKKLENGCDLVIGNRFLGKMEKNAMPFTHRYIGTPLITFLGRKIYKINISDFNSGLRAIKKDKIVKLNLESSGMELASEMLIKAKKNNLVMDEIPIDFFKDKRNRAPHLRPFRDGIRHFRIILKGGVIKK